MAKKTTPRKSTPSRSNSKKSTPVSTPTKQKKPTVKKTDDSVIPKDRVLNAVEQLTKFTTDQAENESSKKNLLEDDDELNKSLNLIVINNKSFTESSKQFKPKLVDVKHSIYTPWKEASVTSVKDFKTLLILKDKDVEKVTEDELFDNLNKSKICVDEIISGNDLKTKYKSFEARRIFINQFQLIFADDSIITTLPKLLGSKSYSKVETTPIPIRTYNSSKQFSVKTIVNSIKKIYLNKLPIKLPRGTTMNVHLGNLEWFKPNELMENIESVAEQLIKNYKIRSIFIKSNQSPVLPLYYNQDTLSELAATLDKSEAGKKPESVNIDGVEVQLSTFDKALMELANPNELSNIFSKQIKDAKRQRSNEDEETKTIKKVKN
ncbi:hypothetical protein KAFR_0J00530 [Kazachstania africana CBS 2517]|uniref:Proteasome-interacting protein CIC1 n=1 Tax=Kazachstania africana (strain ATCC 22294 / BCRC 22015 / CBS 2517 / CECT 1963 / NBRC 1671 / NRRL Y-8276) TaxID=1071382 RepID=H2B0H1_KAZAF|nr:hypothetical protein KAFR_0J00530 [Kazachstania africana CBS 2517]CCF60121.1 hypothetical protein KAFR_0J00530 [Kazachstania africana CBS 2517]